MAAIQQQVQNKPIQKQYIRSLKEICLLDYPEKLPNLDAQIKGYLGESTNMLMVYTGLLGLVAIVSRYEFEVEKTREELYRIIAETFPRLGGLVNEMIGQMDNEDALYMLHMVCKVFYKSNQIMVAPLLMEPGVIDPWYQFFKSILDMPISDELTTKVDNRMAIQ